ncbi:MAG: Fe-S cluster assembly ATPase SufC [Candidatus Berkiella sp.]
MLEIRDLTVAVNDKIILKDFDLTLEAGYVHALMGPNGSGKSTLAFVLAGNPLYTVVKGEINYKGIDVLPLTPDKRALAGIFLALQYPVEIPGIANSYFIKAAMNAQLKSKNLPEIDAMDFLDVVQQKLSLLNMPPTLLDRALNVGFSGGEKKMNEILQLLMLEPTLAILDETDSGLDIDALKTVAEAINSLRSEERIFLVITHYQRLLHYLKPDRVHVMMNGKIVEQGDKELALRLEKQGYKSI